MAVESISAPVKKDDRIIIDQATRTGGRPKKRTLIGAIKKD